LGIAPPGIADGLAWESSGDYVYALYIIGQIGRVVVDWDARPMLPKHALAVGIALTEPGGLKQARLL